MIVIDVTKNDAKVTSTEKLTSGTVGQKCQFNFSEEWNDLSKIAVCVCGSVVKDAIVDENNTIEIPWEVLAKHGKYLDIGVYGTDGNGERAIPTIYATVGAVCKGADPSGDEGIEPTPTIWERVLSFIKNVPYTIDAMGEAIFHGHAESASSDEKGNTIHSHYMSADYAKSTLCNALKGTVEGIGAVRLDGVSPIEHGIEINTSDVKSYGKNLVNYTTPIYGGKVFYLGEIKFPVTVSVAVDASFTNGTVQLRRHKIENGKVAYDRYTFISSGKVSNTSFTIDGSNREFGTYDISASNSTEEGIVKSIQVELGSKETKFEEYKEPIEGVVSVSPTTTLIANTEGTTIKATYNKDINQALAELQNSTLNLGGTL